MKRMLSLMLTSLLFCPMLMTACQTDSSSPDTSAADGDSATAAPPTSAITTEWEAAARDPEKNYKILFIGNSFTYYNDMPTAVFAPLARAAGYEAEVTAITKGGHYLWEFASETDEYGKKVREALAENKYDIVIVQEQSNNPISNPALFYDSVRSLHRMIEANGAEMWLYATWGYGAQKENLTKFGRDTQEMEMKLRAAYTAIADELNLHVAYAGAAMTYALEHSDMNLYHTDYYHPSPIGSNIAGWTLFSSIFGVRPETVDFTGMMTAEAIAIIKEAATYAAFGNITVDETYRTSSVGVTQPESDFASGVDTAKTVMLEALPQSSLISVLTRDSAQTGNGWTATKKDAAVTFSGLRGDKDQIASKLYSETALDDAQKTDIADTGYGVSVVGVHAMNSAKKGYKTAVENLCNGHWGSSYMAALLFDGQKYTVDGTASADGSYAGLITLNFGQTRRFDAIGYFSGSLLGFPQAQDVFVSDDGVNWTKVESACYDRLAMTAAGQDLVNISKKLPDPWNENSATIQCLFSMNGAAGKYIRIGIILGGDVDSVGMINLPTQQKQQINTREILVFGE